MNILHPTVSSASLIASLRTSMRGTLCLLAFVSAATVLVPVASAQTATTLSLTTTPNPSAFHGPVTLTTKIFPFRIPNRDLNGAAVDFFDGDQYVGWTTFTEGTAALTVTNFTSGSHSIVAVYRGDGVFGPSTSNAVAQRVTVASASSATTVHLQSSAPLNGYVTLTAALSPYASSGFSTNGETMTFYRNNTVLGSAMLFNGTAFLRIPAPAAGDYALAIFKGDSAYAGSTSNSIQPVPFAFNYATSLGLKSTSNAGKTSFTAELYPFVPSANGELMTFYDNNSVLGTAPIQNGVATLNGVVPTVGNYTLAVYSGDANLGASVSNGILAAPPLGLPTATSLGISAGPNAVTSPGQAVTLKADLYPYSRDGSTTDGETVAFYSNDKFVGSGVLKSGVATYTTSSLSRGTNAIVAVYSSDAAFVGSVSQVIFQTVTGGAPTPTSLGLKSTASTMPQGNTSSLIAQLYPYTSQTGSSDGTMVQFVCNGKVLGTAPLQNGVAVLNVPTYTLPVGEDQLLASYPGDSNFGATISNFLFETVTP